MPTLEQVISWAKGSGEILRAGYGRTHSIRMKGFADVVTEVDKASEDYLVAQIRAAYPEHTIITEESGHLVGNDISAWYIDPLDGTTNYAHALPLFAVSIGYAEHGELKLGVVYDPIQDECFYAERGRGAFLNGVPLHVSEINQLADSLLVTGFPYDQLKTVNNNLDHFARLAHLTQGVRRLGSAALDLCYVAAGRLEGHWELRLRSWDVAAGTLIVREAGGVVTDWEGTPNVLLPPNSLIAANPLIHPLLFDVLHQKGE